MGTVKHPTVMAGKELIEPIEGHVNNCGSQMGKPLTYVPPSMRDGKLVVKILAKDIKSQEEFWNTALIGYVLGDTPYARSMDNYVTMVWNFVTKPKIQYHDEGYYILKFHTIEDRDLILHASPYTYHNKPFILKNWEIDFYFDPECLSTIPLWVKFSGLLVGYWSPEALSKLASRVGRPLNTDKFTAKLEKISYARVLVEADISQPLPERIEIDTPFGVFQQQVTYDWRIKFCVDCIKFGHDSDNCRRINAETKEETYQEVAKRKNRRNRKKELVWQAKELDKEQGKHKGGSETGTTQVEAQQNASLNVEEDTTEHQARVKQNSKGSKGKNIEAHDTTQREPMIMQKANRFVALRIEEPSTTGQGLVKEVKERKTLHKVAKGWNQYCNYNITVNDRIWLLWKDHINVQILAIKEQYIHCSVEDITSQFSTALTVVYAKNTVQHREELWAELQQVGAPISTPWILCGDFNNVLTTKDRIGQPVTSIEIQGFRGMLNSLQPTPIRSIGWHFTWCNKQPVASRVYRLMGNCCGEIICPNSEIIKKGPVLNMDQKTALVKPVTTEEIDIAIKDIPTDKAPRIDGYPIEAITLIPKVSSPSQVKDYRPIACCNTLSKIIAKLLQLRIKKVIGNMLGHSQSTFIEGRSIIDNIFFNHELFKGYNRKGVSPRCVMKVDLRKAYDTIDRRFLRRMLSDLGFPFKFIEWIMECVTTVSYYLVINGRLTKPFQG
ncbi:uncharacterized protein [Nicotiana tomentosiformis]|uniref:uncharacterized protein n=1 Tax=Nicotiana tomentosiformis TaxID=4098 RepID=UPI00388C4461